MLFRSNDAEKANNYTFANRLRTFLKTWKDNPIDGSLNRETIMLLASAADQWSADPWDLQTYFLSLRTSLNKLVASEEELPRDVDMNQNEPPMGGGGGHGGGGGGPPMSPAFGPEKEEPGAGATEMGGEPGAAGAPGEELGLGGEEGGVEPGEAEGEGLGGPEPEEEPKPRLARL